MHSFLDGKTVGLGMDVIGFICLRALRKSVLHAYFKSAFQV